MVLMAGWKGEVGAKGLSMCKGLTIRKGLLMCAKVRAYLVISGPRQDATPSSTSGCCCLAHPPQLMRL